MLNSLKKIQEFFDSKKFNTFFNIILLILFTVLVFITMMNHEIWRDEAQAWLVVRDLNILGIFNHVKTEGHPLLWYAVLYPFAKLNLPVISMQIISFVLAIIGSILLLWYSPFNKLTKTAVLFSSTMIYWYSIICRSYTLIPPLMFITAFLYPKRHKHPFIYTFLLILLSNTHILMLGFCGILSIIFIFENLKNTEIKDKFTRFTPILLLFFNYLAILIYVSIGKYENVLVSKSISISSDLTNFYLTTIFTIINIFGEMPFIMILLSFTLIIILFVIIFKLNKKIFITVLGSILFQISIYRYIWETSPEKASLILLIILFGFWIIFNQENISAYAKKISGILITVLFFITWNISYSLVLNDIFYNYSGSKDAATYIKNNIPEDAIIISNYNVTTAGISAYIPGQKFYFPPENKFYTFSEWNNGILEPYNNLEDYIKFKNLFKNKDVYYIFSFRLDIQNPKKLIRVYKSPESTLIPTEKFTIYKLKENEK